MVNMRRVRGELPRVMKTEYHSLAHSLDTLALASRNHPLPQGEYQKVLVEAGKSGRAMRAIVSLSAPVRELSVTAVSCFMLSYEGTPSALIGGNHFAAFADARAFRTVDPAFPFSRKVAHSDYARDRLKNVEEVSGFYYLLPARFSDLVLAPWACNCCFDAQFLDYLKSILYL